MKKIIVTILAIVYISSSTGAMLNMHYCMGKLADWGVGNDTSRNCKPCGMQKSKDNNNGCCHDELKFVKNTTDQKAAEAVFQMMHQLALSFPCSSPEIPFEDYSFVTEKKIYNNAPPRIVGVAVYIRNCVFLI